MVVLGFTLQLGADHFSTLATKRDLAVLLINHGGLTGLVTGAWHLLILTRHSDIMLFLCLCCLSYLESLISF